MDLWLKKNIVFIGFRDEKIEQMIIKEDGTIKSTVSKNTILLIYIETDSNI